MKQETIIISEFLASPQCKLIILVAFERAQIHIFKRELKNYLIRHIVYGMVYSFLTNTKSVKQRAVGVYKQPFLGTSYTNIISAKHLIGQLSRLRDKHIHIIKLHPF